MLNYDQENKDIQSLPTWAISQNKQLQLNQLEIDKIEQMLNNKNTIEFKFTVMQEEFDYPRKYLMDADFDINYFTNDINNFQHIYRTNLSEFFEGIYENHKMTIEIDYKYLV